MKINNSSIVILILCFLFESQFGYAQNNSIKDRLKSNSDYFCYYGGFDDNTILQCKYFDLIILDVRYITRQQVEDLRKGFDNISGTDDDVVVIGYLSIGEQDGALIAGDGTGPVYWDGQKIVHENKGYASFYLDDKDKNGIPDKDGIWNSYYVNAGDSAWWEYNKATAEKILNEYNCDGLFLDLVDTGGPNSWGLPYQWTQEGMINYIEHLRQSYTGKYILANRGLFYLDPSLPHYRYVDRYRKAIDGLMVESYYAEWDWNTSRGYLNPEFESNSQHFAPLINAQATKEDGFNVFILDYISKDQPDYSQLLNGVVNAAERDQGWLVAVSSILLDEIRYDTFHHHITDWNPPTWKNLVGVASCEWVGDSLAVYWNAALDQTPPVKYNLYLNENSIDFDLPPQYPNLIPQSSHTYDYKFMIGGLDTNINYKMALRASDNASPEHIDPNRKITEVGTPQNILIDGNFNDWKGISKLNTPSIPLDSAYSQDPDANFTNVWATNDSSKLYLSYQVAGNISSSYFYRVFIDTDSDPNGKTGMVFQDSASIGVEFMVENDLFYHYAGTDWNWTPVSGMQKSDNVGRTELSLPLNVLFSNNTSTNKSVRIIFQTGLSTSPYSSMDIAPLNYKEQYYNYQINIVSDVREHNALPNEFRLDQNYPNPFNPSTNIKFNLVKAGNINLKIYNTIGQLVKTIVNDEYKNKGTYEFKINMDNYSSGIYFYTIVQGSQQITKKMILIK